MLRELIDLLGSPLHGFALGIPLSLTCRVSMRIKVTTVKGYVI